MGRRATGKLAKKIEALPSSPGVYKFLDSKKRVIYVGKAKNLKTRVKSYFSGRAGNNRLELLARSVRTVEIVGTASSAEALIFEAALIKNHKPKFNVELKDDKSYPFLKLSVNEDFPRLAVTRRRLNDGAFYYGPYANAKLLKSAVSFMEKVFPLRKCRKLKKKVCLEYHIGSCRGVCEKKITSKVYGKIVDALKKFLEGKKEELITILKKDMKKFSRQKKYESALSAKRQIEALMTVRAFGDAARLPVSGELDELKSILKMDKVPVVIECFDVSNISGQQAVGSMVRFFAGEPDKSGYRKFRIKNVKGIDDYLMIREVVGRRYAMLIKKNEPLPDLVLIDGGKGHLSVAARELKKLGLEKTRVASIAKEHNHLYTLPFARPIKLAPGTRALFLIQRVRDEAHRFAITYHRTLRRKEKFETSLREIKGVGPVREKKLLKCFGGINGIRKAAVKEIQKVGIDKKTAERIKKRLK
ncbi:MAG: excinuclease ABC subunit UvrC [Candidatus Omnitrophica bacterium]|nr:excinuclease ABC subunit UvrC [Candidatus Omnitrophota bacterium]